MDDMTIIINTDFVDKDLINLADKLKEYNDLQGKIHAKVAEAVKEYLQSGSKRSLSYISPKRRIKLKENEGEQTWGIERHGVADKSA